MFVTKNRIVVSIMLRLQGLCRLAPQRPVGK